MVNKLNAMCVKAYLTVSGFTRELKKDERGLAGVVVAVLLILISVLAIVMLWGSLKDMLKDLWEKILNGGNGGGGGVESLEGGTTL